MRTHSFKTSAIATALLGTFVLDGCAAMNKKETGATTGRDSSH